METNPTHPPWAHAFTWLGRFVSSLLPEESPLLRSAFAYFGSVDIENPVRQFQLLYCLWLAVALMWTLGRQVRFLEWFDNSGCAALFPPPDAVKTPSCDLLRPVAPPSLSHADKLPPCRRCAPRVAGSRWQKSAGSARTRRHCTVS